MRENECLSDLLSSDFWKSGIDTGTDNRHFFMMIEKTEIWITCEKPIEAHGTAVRGFFGNLYRNRQEFYGHRGDECYQRLRKLDI
jgi:hypothetical protein